MPPSAAPSAILVYRGQGQDFATESMVVTHSENRVVADVQCLPCRDV